MTCKYANWTRGQVESLLNVLREENALKLISGELKLALGDDEKTAELAMLIAKLFDRHARRIPSKDFGFAFCDPDMKFHFIKSELVLDEPYGRHCEYFGDPGITLPNFQSRADELMDKLGKNKPIANLANGVCLPIILGKLPKKFNYGKLLEQKFLAAVENAYIKQFPGRIFANHRKGELAGKVRIVHKSHERLIARLKKGPEVALYFPNPLQGFSVLASREQMSDLPKEIYLCGGVDTCTAMAMYAHVLARDWHTPGLDTAALQWRSADYSLYFSASGDDLSFGSRADLARASGRCSAGLLFLA